MPTDAPFIFSIAGISASLAGLAGLVAGLRRGAEFRALDLYRLREIVEFAFSNVLLALATIPVLAITGNAAEGLRATAIVVLFYAALHIGVLVRRSRRHGLERSIAWYVGAGLLDIATLVGVAATVAYGSSGAFEALLVVMLARPMFAFVLVLTSFESSAP